VRLLLLWFWAALLGAEDAPPLQPIPFSHKTHTAAGVKCLDCHALRKPGFAAGIPGEQICMGCHASVKADSEAIQKLAGYARAKKPVPWVRVYRIPDYVWFSHALHHKEAEIGCEVCHGPVGEREVVAKEKPVTMVSCMECHAGRKAPNGCTVCHETR
jgi:cytochrome c7-like protein